MQRSSAGVIGSQIADIVYYGLSQTISIIISSIIDTVMPKPKDTGFGNILLGYSLATGQIAITSILNIGITHLLYGRNTSQLATFLQTLGTLVSIIVQRNALGHIAAFSGLFDIGTN